MPISCDIFSYAIKDTDGAKVVQGCRYAYAQVAVKVGDVIGCFLSLPDDCNNKVAIDYEDPVWLPGLLCDPQYPPTPEVLPGSTLEYSVNGKRYGIAFADVVEGAYYPAISLFMKAKVRVNLGPSFTHLTSHQTVTRWNLQH
jgi:hypothetical protein